jgi:hypothetical protein
MREINRIIIHHTATAQETTVSSIRNYHMHNRGWRDIGYHYLIDGGGFVRLGRPERLSGAHCKGNNRDSIGVAVIGDCRSGRGGNGAPNEEQKAAFFKLLEDLMVRSEKS